MKTTKSQLFASIIILFASTFIGSDIYAAQSEQAYTTAYRYNLGGQLTGTISPDPDGSGNLRLLATRNTYNSAGLLETVEKGELANWADENIEAGAWTGFTIFSTQIITYDGYGRKATVIVKDKTGTAISLKQTNYDTGNRVNCIAVRMNPNTFSTPSALPDACIVGSQGDSGPDRITQFTYDSRDQVLTEQRGRGTTFVPVIYVTNTYDGRRLTSQTDANGNKTELRYDPDYKRLIRMVFPSLTTKGQVNEADYVEFSNFDANGNAKTGRKRNGAIVNYTFDNNNRMITKDYADNTKQKDIYYDYDLRGLQTLASFGTTATADRTLQQYDGFGNLDTGVVSMGGVTRAVYGKYDLNNNRTRVNYGDGVYFTYGFDDLNRMAVLFEGTGTRMLQIDYNSDGHRKRIYRRSGISTTPYSFINGIQLDSFTQDFPGTSYDLTNSFQYNNAGQISQLTLGNNLYYYNGNENRTGVYEPDNLNRYTKIASQPLGYDGNSNLTNDGTLTYQYDDENRLISTGGAVTSAFIYDPRGRLFQSTINGATTQFLYDGDALIAEFSGSGVMQRRYVHGDQVDEPLVQYNSNATGVSAWRYLHADHQGSIIAHSDVNGTVLAKLAYDSYGIPAASNTDRFGYTGQIWFKELGLFHYKARMYHPKIGRFLQTDPIGYKDDMNLYAYVGNDPINMIDQTGMFAVPFSSQAFNPNSGWRPAMSAPTAPAPSPFPASGTREFHLTGTASWSGSATGSLGFATDSHGNAAFTRTGGLGGGTPGVSVEVGVTTTNADSIFNLSGFGGVTTIGGGELIGGSVSEVTGTGYSGVTTSGGITIGPVPVSASGHVTHTWLTPILEAPPVDTPPPPPKEKIRQ